MPLSPPHSRPHTMHISHVSVSMDTTPSLRAVEGRPVSSTRRVVCPDTHVWSDMICASQPHVPTRLRLARPCLRRTGCLCCAPPSSRHESPHALLNTRSASCGAAATPRRCCVLLPLSLGRYGFGVNVPHPTRSPAFSAADEAMPTLRPTRHPLTWLATIHQARPS